MSMHKDLHPRDYIDNMYEEKEEEDSSVLKISLIHQLKELRTKLKGCLVGWLDFIAYQPLWVI